MKNEGVKETVLCPRSSCLYEDQACSDRVLWQSKASCIFQWQRQGIYAPSGSAASGQPATAVGPRHGLSSQPGSTLVEQFEGCTPVDEFKISLPV